MNTTKILNEIDDEIARLQQARALLLGEPKAHAKAPRKRRISPEQRAKISATQRKNWLRIHREGLEKMQAGLEK